MRAEGIQEYAATLFAKKMIEVFGAEACSKITAESLEEARVRISEATDWDAFESSLADIYEEILTGGDDEI